MSEPLRMHPTDLERLADLVADRLAVKLAAPAIPPRMLTASEVADMLGLSRDSVYGMAAELGAVRIGNGSRPRLRFPAEAVEAWSARQGGKVPSAPDPAPRRATRRRASRATGTGVELLPVRGVRSAP